MFSGCPPRPHVAIRGPSCSGPAFLCCCCQHSAFTPTLLVPLELLIATCIVLFTHLHLPHHSVFIAVTSLSVCFCIYLYKICPLMTVFLKVVLLNTTLYDIKQMAHGVCVCVHSCHVGAHTCVNWYACPCMGTEARGQQ